MKNMIFNLINTNIFQRKSFILPLLSILLVLNACSDRSTQSDDNNIARRNVTQKTAEAAQQFIDFITQLEQQKVFVRYGFRSVVGNIDLRSVANSPGTQNIPGAEIKPASKILPSPSIQTRGEIQRLWKRAN